MNMIMKDDSIVFTFLMLSVDSPLTGKEDGRSENALREFATNALVKPLHALFSDNSQQPIQRGLVTLASAESRLAGRDIDHTG